MNKIKLIFFIVAIVFILFDIMTGWIKAISTKTTNSSIMRVGLFHKLGELVAILFGYACEYLFPMVGISVSIPLVEAISTYIILMETASIVENLVKINPALGTILGKIFAREDNTKDEVT